MKHTSFLFGKGLLKKESTSYEQQAIDNYIEVLKDEALEDIECGYKEQGEAKLKEAEHIQSLRNAIESANIHGFLNDWSEEAFLEEFAE